VIIRVWYNLFMKNTVIIIVIFIMFVAMALALTSIIVAHQYSMPNISKNAVATIISVPLSEREYADDLQVNNETITVSLTLHPIRNSGLVSTVRSNDDILLLFESSQKIWDTANITFNVSLKEIQIDTATQSLLAQGRWDYLVRIRIKNTIVLKTIRLNCIFFKYPKLL